MSSAFSQSAYIANSNPNLGDLGTDYANTSGGFGAVGQWLNNIGGAYDYQRSVQLAELDRQFNSQEALANRQWEEYMSNTAYQRQVADMRDAGLNPYLAYGQGGASTPTASPASSRSSGYSSSGTSAGQVITSLLSRLVGGAFGIATQVLRNEHMENAAELKYANAYDMQSRRFENQFARDELKHQNQLTYKYLDAQRARITRNSNVHYSKDKL